MSTDIFLPYVEVSPIQYFTGKKIKKNHYCCSLQTQPREAPLVYKAKRNSH